MKSNVASRAYFNESFKLPNANLKTYYSSVVHGNSDVYDTPFAKGESTEDMLSAWMKNLESVNSEWPSLYAFEVDLANKVGPMSIRLPLKDRMKDIDSYYDGILLPSTKISPAATQAVVNEFARLGGLEIRGQKHTLMNMKLSTNSGSPYFTKRRNVIPKREVRVLPWGNAVVQCGEVSTTDVDYSCAAILGWRGQEGGPNGDDVKQRVVWMFPFAVNICELQVYQPFIESAQRYGLVPAWVSNASVDRRVTKLFDSKAENDLVVCTDFSKFDQHFNSDCQEAARVILEKLMSPTYANKNWLREVFPIKYMIPLAYNWEEVRFGKHGMGSGSGGTNCDETLTHRALQYEAAMAAGEVLNPNSQCLGDDGMLTYPGITVEDVVQSYSSHGLEMNPDKQYASTQDCVYLRRWHHKDYRVDGVCVGVYSTCRALGRLRYLERWQDPRYWDEKGVALRQLSILENVKYHPLKEQFVQFCLKRDKYRLGIDIPGFLDNIETVANEAIVKGQQLGSYMQSLQDGYDSVAGIGNWWIVDYLKQLR
jgi:hypothetical protein